MLYILCNIVYLFKKNNVCYNILVFTRVILVISYSFIESVLKLYKKDVLFQISLQLQLQLSCIILVKKNWLIYYVLNKYENNNNKELIFFFKEKHSGLSW